jgi:hypothetical protein
MGTSTSRRTISSSGHITQGNGTHHITHIPISVPERGMYTYAQGSSIPEGGHINLGNIFQQYCAGLIKTLNSMKKGEEHIN